MLDYTKDAIVVTDKENTISLANFEAQRIFSLISEKEIIVGSSIQDFLPNTTAISDESIDKLYHTNGLDYLVSSAPIIVRKKIIGQIFIIRDATELHLLTDRLFNTTAYATTLQAQSHNFLNKLHVIYGLTDLEDYEQLMEYLEKILEPEQEFAQRMVYLVHNPVIAGFLIGERSKFSEKNSPFMIEVYPDIPVTDQQNAAHYWMSLIRVLNQFILEHELAEKLQIRFGFWNQHLQTTYELELDTRLQSNLLNEIEGAYFKKILLRANGQMNIEKNKNWLKITFSVAYSEELL
ncbi:sensor histidine kinase [Carnobacterium sp. FSL E2-0243]